MVHLFLSLRYDQVSDTHNKHYSAQHSQMQIFITTQDGYLGLKTKCCSVVMRTTACSTQESRVLSACLKMSMSCADKRQRHPLFRLSEAPCKPTSTDNLSKSLQLVFHQGSCATSNAVNCHFRNVI